MAFLPTTKKEVEDLGWDEIDVILFSGDAYIDHPSMAAAVVGRTIESTGLRVAIVPQPNWRDDLRDFKKLGKPRLFFAVSPGAMDSMVNHYTAARRKRSDDAYTPEGRAGARPDYPSIVYTQILKRLYPDVPVIVGGIEASLRRVTHYDYWQDKLRPSLIVDCGADMLLWGMGERTLLEMCALLKKGVPFSSLTTIRQTVLLQDADAPLPKNKNWETIELASHEKCLEDKVAYAHNFKIVEEQSNLYEGAARLIQKVGDKVVIINPQYPVPTTKEVDFGFDLPYERLPHPRYKGKEIPAYEMIKHSVNIHRGCFGGCAFCTISAHQGKFISSRSERSILKEVEAVTKLPSWRGNLSDLGGPSANMYQLGGRDIERCKICRRPSCIAPSICPNLNTDHTPLLELYKKVAKIEGVKRIFIGSGVRYDMLLNDKATEAEKKSHACYAEQLISKHVSGRLKVAPEHTEDAVLNVMRKPTFALFYKFKKIFDEVNKKHGLKQQLIPYFISSHPGSTDADMAELAIKTKELDFKLEQVQDFTPTPMTVSTEIYYSGVHPYTLKPVYTAKTPEQKQRQRMFFFWYKPEFKAQIMGALKKMGKWDLAEKLFARVGNARIGGSSMDDEKEYENYSDHRGKSTGGTKRTGENNKEWKENRREKREGRGGWKSKGKR